MRRFVAGMGLATLLAGCSQPTFYEMKPTTVTFETKGSTQQVRAVAKDRRGNEYPTRKPTRWESSDEKVASVDENGKVTAIGPGVATIRAIRGDLHGEVMVDVNTVEQLVVEPGEVRLPQDSNPFQPRVELLDYRQRPMKGRRVQARCLDEKVCTVDPDHRIWTHNPGETIYEVKHEELVSTVKVVVEPQRGTNRR